MKRLRFALVCLGVIFIFTAIAEGPCYGADNVINACVGRITGLIRIVDAPGKCLRLETPLSWNRGPQVAYGSLDYTGLTRCTGNCTMSPFSDPDCAGGMPCRTYLVTLNAMTDPSAVPTCLVTNHGWENYEGSAGADQALVYVSYPDEMDYMDGRWTFTIGTGAYLVGASPYAGSMVGTRIGFSFMCAQ